MLPSHGELHNYFPRPNADNVVNIANADLLRERERKKKKVVIDFSLPKPISRALSRGLVSRVILALVLAVCLAPVFRPKETTEIPAGKKRKIKT